ncbi:hypothetical protein DESC_710055 [Desulfosarcina cetonica]|nr:hypothetical protein DESC_710055 [Desulfosarcina cetonica]
MSMPAMVSFGTGRVSGKGRLEGGYLDQAVGLENSGTATDRYRNFVIRDTGPPFFQGRPGVGAFFLELEPAGHQQAEQGLPHIKMGMYPHLVGHPRRNPLGGIGAHRVEFEFFKQDGKLQTFHLHGKGVGIFQIESKGQIQGGAHIIGLTLGGRDFLGVVPVPEGMGDLHVVQGDHRCLKVLLGRLGRHSGTARKHE